MKNKIILTSVIVLLCNHSVSIAKESSTLITATSVGNVKLGDKYSSVLKAFRTYKPQVTDEKNLEASMYSGINVLSGKDLILSVTDKNMNKTKVVKYMRTCSNKLSTKEGLKPGMKLYDLFKIFPDMVLRKVMNPEEGDQEFFEPQAFQTKNTTFRVEIRSNIQGQTAGIYSGNSPDLTTKKFKGNAKLGCIEIFEGK